MEETCVNFTYFRILEAQENVLKYVEEIDKYSDGLYYLDILN
jgi:hypothetical protein